MVSGAGPSRILRGREDGGPVRSLDWRLGPSIELFAPPWPNVGMQLHLGFSGALEKRGNPDAKAGLVTGPAAYGGTGIHYYF